MLNTCHDKVLFFGVLVLLLFNFTSYLFYLVLNKSTSGVRQQLRAVCENQIVFKWFRQQYRALEESKGLMVNELNIFTKTKNNTCNLKSYAPGK